MVLYCQLFTLISLYIVCLLFSIDVNGVGHVGYKEFAQYLMVDEFGPSDTDGVSMRVVKENRESLKELRQDQERRQQDNQRNESHHVTNLTTDEIIHKLR